MKKKKWLAPVIIGGIFVASVIFATLSIRNSKRLDVYTKPDTLNNHVPGVATEDVSEKVVYVDEKAGFNCEVPSNWTKVIKDGYATYIHAASCTSVQYRVEEYNPIINNVTAADISEQVVSDGYVFLNASSVSSSWYEIMYTDQTGEYDYIEEVRWNRNYIVSQVFCVKSDNYEKLQEELKDMVASFSFSEPIHEDYYLYYMPAFSCEIAIPVSWNVTGDDSGITIINPDDTAIIGFMCMNYTGNIEDMTTIDATDMFSQGKAGFMLNDFSVNDGCAIVKYSYNGDQQNITYLFSSGKYLYILSFEYFTDIDITETIEDCIGMFRYF